MSHPSTAFGESKVDDFDEWASYRRLLKYATPYKVRLFWGIVFGAIFGGSTLGAFTSLHGGLVDIFGGKATAVNEAVQTYIENWTSTTASSMQVTIGILVVLLLFALLRSIGFFLSKYCVEWVGHRVVTDLRNETFAHIQDLSLPFFTKSRTGELMSRTTSDTQMVERGVSTVIGDLVREPFVLVAAVIMLVRVDPRLALISLGFFPVCIIPVAIFGRRVRRFAREGQARLADLASIQQETITGVRIVKAFGMEDVEKERFSSRSGAVFRRMIRVAVARAAVIPIIEFLSVVAACAVLLYAQWARMSWDELVVFLAALVLMYQPVKKLSRLHLGIQQSAAAADRIFEILDTTTTITNRPNAKPLEPPIHAIAFEGVSFAYADEAVLRDISLTVKAGECTALVGSSGTGKTTMVSLIPRFFDVTSGRIVINGTDIRDFTLKSLRAQIGLVTQETILFNDTVANNIAYGRRGASQDDIEDAARRAHAHSFIMDMPEGYDTLIGERGVRLSGGQCQRLSIARAILRNPPILILDEATSSLDTESERQVQAALDELMAHRTVFAIAHRLSTIAQANRIIVLDKGRIAEQGTHGDLLAKGGIYKYLYDLQFADQEGNG